MKPFDRVYRHYDSFMNRFKLYRVDQIVTFLDLKKNYRVADLGGGTGKYSCAISKVCKEVHLFDESEKMISVAKHHEADNIVIYQCDITATPAATHFFDAVLIADVFHHIKHHQQLIDESSRILKKGGALVIMDFDFSHFHTKILAVFETFLFGLLHYRSRRFIDELLASKGFIKELESLDGALFIERWRKR